MLETELVKRAYVRAAELHADQLRKGGTGELALTHLESVAETVSQYTDDEEIVAAALLHDTLEDTPYTKELMEEEFGERVTEIVLGVTIPEALEGQGGDWLQDRTRYIENLRHAPAESALVAAADKIHNFSSVLGDYGNDFEAFNRDFSGLTGDRIAVYRTIVEMLAPRIPEKLATELISTWERYRLFVERVGDTTESV